MQLILAFLKDPPAQPALTDRLDPEARVGAIRVLARIIAQAITAAEQKEATDE